MNKNLLRMLFAPEGGEGGGGGGGGNDAPPAIESHEAAADKVFGASPAPAAAAETPKPAEPAKTPAVEQKEAPPAKASIFDKLKPAAAAQKDPAKPAEELPEDKINLGDKATSETRKHFDAMKGITKTLRQELAARDARMKALEAKASGAAPQLPADYEKLKTEHKTLSEKLAVLDLQNHPDFIRQFTEPKQKIASGLATVLTDNQQPAVDLTSMLHKPRAEYLKAASEIAEKLPEYERFEFMTGARQLYQLSQAEREALSNSGELRKGFQAKTLEAQRAAFGKTFETLTEGGALLPKLDVPEGAGDEDRQSIEAYNKALEGMRGSAEKLAFEPNGEAGVAQTAVKAAAYDFFAAHVVPRMEKEYRSAVALVGQLQKELQEIRGKKGEGAGSGGGADDAGQTPAVLSHEAAAEKIWGRQ